MASSGSKLTQRWRPRFIRDDRGRKVTQLDPVALYVLHQPSVLDRESLRAISNEKGVHIKRGERAALMVGLTGAVLVIGLFTHSVITQDIYSGLWARTAGLFYLCSIPFIIWFTMKRKRFGEIAAAMIKHRHCPHCGYDLRLLPVDPRDGATVCPECGCAWKLPLAGEPART